MSCDYGVFTFVPFGSVAATGRLKDFLERQHRGLSGHYKEQGWPFDTCMWTGSIPPPATLPRYKIRQTFSLNWWPYEQTGYLLDGVMRLGILCKDPDLVALFERNLKALLSCLNYGGMAKLYKVEALWPLTVFLRGALAFAEATDNQYIFEEIRKFADSLSPEQIAEEFRGITFIEIMAAVSSDSAKALKAYELHNVNHKITEDFETELWQDKLQIDGKLSMHGVTVSEELKIPVLLYMLSGNKQYLQTAETILERILADHEQPVGMISATEYLSGHEPTEGYETCVISDFSWTLGYFLAATGKVEYADRIEKIIYNALPGAVNKEFTAVQYISAPNQVICTPFSHHSHFGRGQKAWRQYAPNHSPECCPGNVHRALPDFIGRLFMLGKTGEPAAVLFGDCCYSGTFGGADFTIEEHTDYPYEDTIVFTFKLSDKLKMPFKIRIPGWCKKPEFKLNGQIAHPEVEDGFAVFEQTWQTNDCIVCFYPVEFELKSCRQWRWLERGAIVFALPVAAQIERENSDFLSPLRFPPISEWGYALNLEPEQLAGLELKHCNNGIPEVEVPALLIRGYGDLNQGRYTPEIPLFYHLDKKEQMIKLQPMGSSELRITAFPDTNERQLIPVIGCWAWQKYFPFNRNFPLEEQCFEPEKYWGEDFLKRALPLAMQCNTDGSFDLIGHYHAENNVLAYIQLNIWADQPGAAILALAAADCAIGWLNGKKILQTNAINEMETTFEEWFDIELKSGMNYLTLKVADCPRISQYRRGWGVSVRIFRNGTQSEKRVGCCLENYLSR